MQRSVTILCTSCLVLILGAGCFQKTEDYIEAPKPPETDIEPNIEGARASTGGFEATVTPIIKTERLIRALPPEDAVDAYAGETPTERKDVVPLPDGTQGEYVSVKRNYVKSAADSETIVQAVLTDTRSLPILTAFLESYSEYDNDSGYRKLIDVMGNEAWVTYMHDASGSGLGFGQCTMLYRERFLVQIVGNMGVTEDELVAFARAFTLEELD